MRYRLRTLLIVLAPCLCSIVGAFAGLSAHVTWPLSLPNAGFAVGWGTLIGVIPSVAAAAFLVDTGNDKPAAWWFGALAVGVVSGATIWAFSAITV